VGRHELTDEQWDLVRGLLAMIQRDLRLLI
jgi:hypothetical protein